MAPTSADAALAALNKVKQKEQEWFNKSVAERLSFLHDLRERLWEISDQWAQKQTKTVSGVDSSDDKTYGFIKADSYAAGPAMAGAYINVLIDSFNDYVKSGNQWRMDIHPVSKRGDSHVIQTFPYWTLDKISFAGFKGEIYVDGSKPLSRGSVYEKAEPGCVAILGAGNFAAPIEVLTKLFIERKVCVYKPNPVNGAVTSPMFSFLFQPLIDAGVMSVLSNEGLSDRSTDIAVATAMVEAEATTEVMITGSHRTYDAIVWGAPGDPKEQQRRKDAGERQCGKKVDAELGNVNVVSIFPGKWSEKEMSHQAGQIAAVRLLNGGHTCPSPQILLVDSEWPQLNEFVALVKQKLAKHPPPSCYYPGSERRQKQFQEEYKESCEAIDQSSKENNQHGETAGKFLPTMWINDLNSSDMVLTEESFCPVIGVRRIDVDGSNDAQRIANFATEAANFINNYTWGNLSTTILAPSIVMETAKSDVEAMVNELRVGAIGVNVWGGGIVFFGQLHWGAYPGNTPSDIQSGIGFGCGNFWMYDGLQKAVLWTDPINPAHSQPSISPVHSVKASTVMKRLTQYNTYPSVWQLLKLVSAAVLGM